MALPYYIISQNFEIVNAQIAKFYDLCICTILGVDFMYTAQKTIERIQSVIKDKGLTQKLVLSECGISENTVKRMTDNKGISSFYLAKIADYLDCSVDYLLGRTDNPQINSGNSITTGNIHGDNNANMSIGTEHKSDDAHEIMEMIQDLSLVQRSEIVVMISKMKSKK